MKNKQLKQVNKINKNNQKTKISFLHYFLLIFFFLFGFYSKKNNRYLECSKHLIKKAKIQDSRKKIQFPVKNPDTEIINKITNYQTKHYSLVELKQKKKQYLHSITKRQQEDYAISLRKYKQWKFFYPFYFLWMKFIRLFNLDVLFNKNKAYEYSNDQLSTLNYEEKQFKTNVKKFFIFNWFNNYYEYLKLNLATKKYQKNNWITFITFTIFFIIILSILISYNSYAINGKIVSPPFATYGTWLNFFSTHLALGYAALYLAVIALILVLLPWIVLLALWLTNINDATYNIFYICFQQGTYLLNGLLSISSIALTITFFYAH